MEPEGVVNALSRIHRALKTGGFLLDLHPTKPFATVEAGGVGLGALDELELMELVAETEAGLDETVQSGLFTLEKAVRFDVLERFDSADELVRRVDDDWFGASVPKPVARAVRAGDAPFDIRERVVLQRFRVL
jgi:2-polyprenyl-6-methoxyphenol hydroxylase-like FAD-dependent oxidoreductase